MPFDFQKRTQTKIEDNPVGKLLDSLRMDTAFFTQSTLTEPWAMEMPPMPNCMMYHLVIDGEAHFETQGQFETQKQEFVQYKGDFVLFPKGTGHKLSDGTTENFTPLHDLPIEHVTERFEILTFGGNGDKSPQISRLMCGVLLFQHPLAIKLLGILPNHIRIKNDVGPLMETVNSISNLIHNEVQNITVGAEAVIARLADILVIAAMRQYLNDLADDELGWLSALEDERIGKALKLLHQQPAKHWSLDELASAIGMSRASFAQQFKRLVGNTPMDYLTEWRMSLAYSQLQLSKDTILSIALDIGYQSEAAFSRAFKKVIGKSPGQVRKGYQAITE